MSGIPAYEPSEIETRWQGVWEAERAYVARDDLPRERCYYVLEMFPYPSGKLHMGHVRNYSIGDAIARYKRMRGLHVLHPMGWDSFGLPAEQAAIERGLHPKDWTYNNIAHMRAQLKRLGFSYDWTREFATSDERYAHMEQQLVLDLVELGLVYRKSATVNWSTGLNTVLANEQVIDGRCWRTGTPVIQKELPQWFFRITAYAEELLQGTYDLDGWPEAVRIMQRNWIGRSVGAEIDFGVEGIDEKITVFTTRPDTVFGVTFMSLAPEHPLVERIVSDERRAEVRAFRDALAGISAEDRVGEASEKKGVFTGAYAINPVNGERVPVYVANFVLAGYGTGAVMAVPAHDTRDFAFAKAYKLPIRRVIAPAGVDPASEPEEAWVEPGTMARSGDFDGLGSEEAKEAIVAWMAERGIGRRQETWRLRDWLVSRQRYWGNPIPFVYGDSVGAVPLAKDQLPVRLPYDVAFDGVGNPLEKHPTWATSGEGGEPLTVRTASGREPARRETDTMDTFVESSWYFARYTCADADAPLDRRRVDHWLPVDLYIGGIEHACLHLLYARYFQKALCDAGYSAVREPFRRLLCQGMVVAETYFRERDGKRQWFNPADVDVRRDDKGAIVGAVAKSDGQPVQIGRVEKMSKSKNNGVDPQAIVDRFGADTARLFILSNVPPEKDLVWDDAGVAGSARFLKRVWTFVHEHLDALRGAESYQGRVRDLPEKADQDLLRQVHATVKRVTDAMERDFGFNTAVAGCMTLSNLLDPARQDPRVVRRAVETLLLLLNPLCPHIAHELWAALGLEGWPERAGWPSYDEAEMAQDEVEYPVQVNGKVRGRISLPSGLTEKGALESAVRDHAQIREIVGDKQLRKLIVVPGKIVNLVVG